MVSPALAAGDGSYDLHLRSLSAAARNSAAAADPASNPNLLQSVRKVCEMCKEAKESSDEMVARAFPVMSKLFQRCAAAPTQSVASSGVLLLTILQFFLDFGEAVLHDADGSLRTFFRSCLSREFADPIAAEQTLEFLIVNRTKILSCFPTLIPQIGEEVFRSASVDDVSGIFSSSLPVPYGSANVSGSIGKGGKKFRNSHR